MPLQFNPFTGTFDVTTKGDPGDTTAATSGTAASPGFAFASDPNTGIYNPGADQLALSTNGTGRLFVDANGNVSTGTSNVSGSTTGRNVLTLNGTSSVILSFVHSATLKAYVVHNSNDLEVRNVAAGYLSLGTNGSERLRITSAGLVGIGTSSPQGSLHVVGNSATAGVGNINISNAAFPTSGWAFRIPDSGSTIDLSLDGAVGGTFRSVMYFARSTGAVGIGSTVPGNYTAVGANNLVVGTNSGNNGITVVGGTTGFSSLAFADSAGSGGPGDYAGLIQYGHAADSMNFFTGAQERARIDSSGTFRVKGAGTAGVNDAVQLNGSAPANSLLLDASGRLLVGTSSSFDGSALQVNGNISQSSIFQQYTASFSGGDVSSKTLNIVVNNSTTYASSLVEVKGSFARGTSSRRYYYRALFVIEETGATVSALFDESAAGVTASLSFSGQTASLVLTFSTVVQKGAVCVTSTNSSADQYLTSVAWT